jgi:hypothetical protein
MKEALMLRLLVVLALLFPVAAMAQTGHQHHGGEGSAGPDTPPLQSPLHQGGQAAFAAIQEIVQILEADPATDWSKVDIDALRRHLVDMDNVVLRAKVTTEPVEGGVRFVVSGDGAVADSIRRMVLDHAATMNGVGGWTYSATATDSGAVLTVEGRPEEITKLRGLGFFGIMTRGMHHQHHHLMIARGQNPHH